MTKQNDYDYSSLSQMLEKSCEKHKSNTCFKFFDKCGKVQEISYADFLFDVKGLSFSLKKLLGSKKSKIAVCMRNCYSWCVSYFAICHFGAICVPLDKELSEIELLDIIAFADIDAIITEEKIAQKLVLKDKNVINKIKIITDSGVLQNNKFISFFCLLNSGKSLLKKHKNEKRCEKKSDETAVILFTSGTSAVAKGVMLSNENICSDIKSISNIISFDQRDSTLCVLPLHHAFQAIVMLIMISVGGCISFSRGLRYIISDMKVFSPSIFVTVPVMLEKMHKKIASEIFRKATVSKALSKTDKEAFNDKEKHELLSIVREFFGEKIRYIITGAAPLNSSVARDLYLLGIPVIIGYGLTECSPIVICNSENNLTFDSIGKPVTNVEARIENSNEDGIGEICVKGPMVMLGYYKNEKETNDVLKDGWLYTGDLGFIDENENFHITGRSKNVIVSKNGKNIYPEEIEYYLSRQEFISECFIFSKDENKEICATVKADISEIKNAIKEKQLSEKQIEKAVLQSIKKTNAFLQPYKRIRKVFLKNDEFIKTASSKIKRNCEENKNGKEIL